MDNQVWTIQWHRQHWQQDTERRHIKKISNTPPKYRGWSQVLANSKLFLLLIKHPPCDSSSQMLPVTNKHKQHNLLQRTQEVHLEVSIMLTNRTRSCSKILYLLTNNEWRIQMISSSRTTRIYDFTTEEIIILS